MTYGLTPYRIFSCLSALVFAHVSFASDATGTPWEFQLTPLLVWGSTLDGDSVVGNNAGAVAIKLRDDDLDNMEAGYGLHFEAKKNEFSLFTDYQYLNSTPEVDMGSARGKIDFRNIMFEIGSAFVFSDTGSTTVESLFGFRYIDQQADINNKGDFPLPAGPDIDGSDQWWHPFMGLRLGQRLSERWSLQARSDFGYRASDNKAVNASAMIEFRFKPWGSLFAGYRYIDFDYDQGNGNSRYAFQAAQQGPLAGVNFFW